MKTVDTILELLQVQNKQQKELTKFLQIGDSSISEWKKGKTKSYLKYIDKIAQFFGVSVDYLLGLSSDSTASEEEKEQVRQMYLNGLSISDISNKMQVSTDAIYNLLVRLDIKIEIIGCPIVRESDGLALSSRNMLLSADERERALTISRALFASVEYAAEHTLAQTKSFVEEIINGTEGLQLEYFQIVDGNTLQEIKGSNLRIYRNKRFLSVKGYHF